MFVARQNRSGDSPHAMTTYNVTPTECGWHCMIHDYATLWRAEGRLSGATKPVSVLSKQSSQRTTQNTTVGLKRKGPHEKEQGGCVELRGSGRLGRKMGLQPLATGTKFGLHVRS